MDEDESGARAETAEASIAATGRPRRGERGIIAPPPSKKRPRVRAILKANPFAKQTTIARELGISKYTVSWFVQEMKSEAGTFDSSARFASPNISRIFPNDVAVRGAKRFKRYVVRQTPTDAVGFQIDSFYDGGIQGFCFGFPLPGELETNMNFTRRTLFWKLRETFRLPFYVEAVSVPLF